MQLINEAVPNHDGKITFNDFVKIMKDDPKIIKEDLKASTEVKDWRFLNIKFLL